MAGKKLASLWELFIKIPNTSGKVTSTKSYQSFSKLGCHYGREWENKSVCANGKRQDLNFRCSPLFESRLGNDLKNELRF